MNPKLRDLDRARAYHDATKHTWESVRRPGRRLDWANQPSPFLRHEGAPTVPLAKKPRALDGALDAALGRLLEPIGASPPAIDAELIARLLFHSVAISAWKQQRARDGSLHRWSLRVNPSSGNLHPTETWLALRGARGLEDGLWHFDVERNAIELVRRGDAVSALLGAAGRATDGVRLVIALGSIVWREAWKYEERAFRYCALDAGHAAHAILLAARALGLEGGAISRFEDELVARALALTSEPPRQTPFLLIPLGARSAIAPLAHPNPPREADEVGGLGPPLGRASALSPSVRDHPLCDAIAEACALDEDDVVAPIAKLVRRGRALEPPAFTLPAPAPLATPLASVVRRRRSALDFDRDRSGLELEELAAILAAARATFPLDAIGAWPGADPTPDGLVVHVWPHAVRGLGSGLYRVANDGRALAPLRATGEAPGRREAHRASLEQDIAGDGACALSIVADLEAHLAAHGCRGYRDAHVLAGAAAHALYLAATALGHGATGIGAFYDEETIALCELDRARDGEPVYHFAIGASVLDDRLVGEDVAGA